MIFFIHISNKTDQMFPDKLKKSVELILTNKFEKSVQISQSRSIGGGCINDAYSLNTNTGKYFIKYNSANAFPGMFEKEADGLKILSDSNSITVPEVIATGATDTDSYLLLQYIESVSPGRHFWVDFGTNLADLHRNSSAYFGLNHDNYIGSLVQTNKPHPDFFGFFISQRIEPQLKNARNKGTFSQSDLRYFDSLFNSLHNIVPIEKPALIHGDLWNGNFMISADGSPCLIDPAVYYGHRESDIAMTQLFGGFHPDFYHAYNHAWPMEKDWQKRMDIFNLYPLLVHVNLFGGGYAGQVLRIIRQF
jgi:protein-ribulosamine 3-kinase